MRDEIKKDNKNFYTYSKDYLTLSIDPYTLEDAKKEKEKLEKTVIFLHLFL